MLQSDIKSEEFLSDYPNDSVSQPEVQGQGKSKYLMHVNLLIFIFFCTFYDPKNVFWRILNRINV